MSAGRFATMLLLLLAAGLASAAEPDTLPPLAGGRVPRTLDEIWGNYDPAKEPIEAEILKQWDEDGVECRIVRYRVGVFKGVKSRVADIYAYPKGGAKLPGLVQVHGGGQSANLNAALTNARRGYACISLNWAIEKGTQLFFLPREKSCVPFFGSGYFPQ